jgi:hypothetical protein
MTIAVRTDIHSRSAQAYALSKTIATREAPAELSTADLAFRVFAAFRAHPHISNVLTNISLSNWTRVEDALRAILDPATTSDRLSPLAHNILDLMCAERGITGRILKPYFHAVLHRLLDQSSAARLIGQAETLLAQLERTAECPPTDASSVPPKGARA